VLAGVGKTVCGTLKCRITSGLKTFEVPFNYQEHGQSKSELVKLRICEGCSEKLNFIRMHKKKNDQHSPPSSTKKRRREDPSEKT
jgi:protein FRA10AC1